MAETQQTQSNATPQDAGMQEKLAQLAQEKAAELEELATKQVMEVMSANPKQRVTMTEVLAGEGAFADKAKALGVTAEWQKFTAEQQEIGKLREELLTVEDQRAADASKVAGITPSLEQEAGKIRKTSTIAGIAGAAIGGAGTAFVAAKRTQSTPMRALFGGAGAILGGALAAIFGAKSGANKAADNIQQQLDSLGSLEPNEKLDEKSDELQTKLGQMQQESISGITGAMVERMVEQQIVAEQQAAQQQAQEAAAKEQEAAAKKAEQEAAAQAEKQPEQKAEHPVPEQGQPAAAGQEAQVAAAQGHAGQGQPAHRQEAVNQQFDQIAAAEYQREFDGMAASGSMGQPSQYVPQAGNVPQHPQSAQQAAHAPMEQALARRALDAQGGSKAEAVLREREQGGAGRQM